MKAALLLLIFIAFWNPCFSQLSLPKASTTEKKALMDLISSVSNEDWFITKDTEGLIVYNKYFKNTPVGIKHAFEEYKKLTEGCRESDCTDESLYSTLTVDSDGSIDYEMLSLTVKSESSEIKKLCIFLDKVISSVSLYSSNSGKTSYLHIFLRTTKK